jgi:hypothetical protein
VNDPTDKEIRPSRQDLIEIFRQVLDPEVLINVDICLVDIDLDWAVQTVRVAGWRLAILWHGNHIDHLSTTDDPLGRHWSYGCDRWPSWEAGPDSVPLCPIQHLLSGNERKALKNRLLATGADPEPPLPVNVPTVDQIMTDDYMELMGV